MTLDATDRRIVDELQKELPLVHRPFLKIAQKLGLEESEVVRRAKTMRKQGYIRRLGPIIDNDVLGRATTLAVARVPPERVEQVGAMISSHPGVTHNYLRKGKGRDIPYNLWFTLTAASDDELAASLRDIQKQTGVPVESLRAKRKFKVGVRFPVLDYPESPD